jgi:hypothetical protein
MLHLQQISSENSPLSLLSLWRMGGMNGFNRRPRTQPQRLLQKPITHRQLLAYCRYSTHLDLFEACHANETNFAVAMSPLADIATSSA